MSQWHQITCLTSADRRTSHHKRCIYKRPCDSQSRKFSRLGVSINCQRASLFPFRSSLHFRRSRFHASWHFRRASMASHSIPCGICAAEWSPDKIESHVNIFQLLIESKYLTETSSFGYMSSSRCGSFCINVLFFNMNPSKSIGSAMIGLLCEKKKHWHWIKVNYTTKQSALARLGVN